MRNLRQCVLESIMDDDDNLVEKSVLRPSNAKELEDIIIDALKHKKTNLNFIKVDQVKSFSFLFSNINDKIIVGDIDISEWDVSNATSMNGMFYGCASTNADLSKWDVSNVKNMEYMFCGCRQFNTDLSKWDVSNVINMGWMFNNARQKFGNIGCWDVRNVEDFDYMFSASPFHCDLSDWMIDPKAKTDDMFFNSCFPNKEKPKSI